MPRARTAAAYPITSTFQALFYQTITASGTWAGSTLTPNSTTASGGDTKGSEDGNAGAYVSFNTSTNSVVDVAIGISYVSIANAQLNLTTETPPATPSTGPAIFANEEAAASTAWNNRLNIIQVSGGATNDLTAFYTALYHTMIEENVLDDVNGQYPAFNSSFTAQGAKTVDTVASGHHQYTDISGWDLYRTESPLMALLLPSVDSNVVQSLINDATQSDQALPRWVQENSDSLGMIGDGESAIVDDAFAFGAATGLTSEESEISTLLQNNANGVGGVRGGAAQYNAPGGYVDDNASETLEYAITDLADAEYFQSIGNTSLYQTYLALAQNWENNFDPNNLSINSRSASGRWDSSGTGWTEGTQPQYTWMVPFNQAGLVTLMGGDANVISRLNTLFTQLNAGPGSQYYFAGNEPDESQPWSYDYAGAPWLTQSTIRRIQTTLYTNTQNWPQDGLPGNDDGGAMSSWYVFSALGLYPMVSGVGGFVIGSPLFTSATVNLQGGQVLQINGNNAADANPYVQSMQINGQASTSLWLPVSTILNAATTTLNFNLGPTANTSWGINAADAPPSFDLPAPTVQTPASATSLNATAMALGVLGANAGSGGDAGLTYTWSVTAEPPGASPPIFSINGSNAAKHDVATFTQAGNYTLLATISNGAPSVTTSVNVTVNPTLTTLVLTPATATVPAGGTEQFAAQEFDQFGAAMTGGPAVSWSVVAGGAGGTISTSGLYTAPAVSGTADTVLAAAGGQSATATVSVVPAGTGVLTNSADIGSPAMAGSTSYDAPSNTYTLLGGGADIAGYSDSFQFAYTTLSGDSSIVAEVTSLQYTSALAKAGIMFRDSSLAANAPMAFLAVAADNNLMFETRTTSGGLASVQIVPGFSPSIWLKLTRSGSSFSAFYAVTADPSDSDWVPVGSPVTISSLSTLAEVGLAVTAHSKTALNASTYTGTSVSSAAGNQVELTDLPTDTTSVPSSTATNPATSASTDPSTATASSPPASINDTTAPTSTDASTATTSSAPATNASSESGVMGPLAPVGKPPTVPALPAVGIARGIGAPPVVPAAPAKTASTATLASAVAAFMVGVVPFRPSGPLPPQTSGPGISGSNDAASGGLTPAASPAPPSARSVGQPVLPVSSAARSTTTPTIDLKNWAAVDSALQEITSRLAAKSPFGRST